MRDEVLFMLVTTSQHDVVSLQTAIVARVWASYDRKQRQSLQCFLLYCRSDLQLVRYQLTSSVH